MFGAPRVTGRHIWFSRRLIHFAVKRVWLMSLFARYQSCLIVLFCFAGERVLRLFRLLDLNLLSCFLVHFVSFRLVA
jgi:hypothetical protein